MKSENENSVLYDSAAALSKADTIPSIHPHKHHMLCTFIVLTKILLWQQYFIKN